MKQESYNQIANLVGCTTKKKKTGPFLFKPQNPNFENQHSNTCVRPSIAIVLRVWEIEILPSRASAELEIRTILFKGAINLNVKYEIGEQPI